jgi:hypothetical protein
MNSSKAKGFLLVGPCSLALVAAFASAGYVLAEAAKDVNVVNQPTVTVDSTQPVNVRDVDSPGRTPFQVSHFLVMDSATQSTETTFSVPAGKRLIIEFVSAITILPETQKLLLLLRHDAGTVPFAAIPLQLVGRFADSDEYASSQLVRLYAEPESTLTIFAYRNEIGGGVQIVVTVVGHLVDAQ